MKKITFLFLLGFLLFSCTKPDDMNPPVPEVKTPATPETVAVVFTTTITNVTVFDGTDGKISISATAGVTPFKYKIGTGNYRTTSVFDSLKANTYTVTVQDSKNTIASKDVVINQAAMPVLAVTVTSTNILMYGLKTGTITATITSGMPPYSYTIGDTTNSTGVFTKLYAKTYNVTVTDNKQQTFNQSVIISQPEKQLLFTSTLLASSYVTSDMVNIFNGRNRFSISFWYETIGSQVNKYYPSRVSADLIDIINAAGVYVGGIEHPFNNAGDGCIKLQLSTSGISYKRYTYKIGSPYEENVTTISYSNPDVYKSKHHVVITYNGTDMSLYVDNVLISTSPSSVNINSKGVYVGNAGDPGVLPVYYNWNYNGTISKMNIYNEALTPSDVATLFAQ
jgi:hypothetical protein